MKVFLDSNVYVAETLLGRGAERMIRATVKARWRIYSSRYQLEEVGRVTERLGFSRRLAVLSQRRIRKRATLLDPPPSRHAVKSDPWDSSILQAALSCGADYLVTNDRHLLDLNPYEGLEVISMDDYLKVLGECGLLP